MIQSKYILNILDLTFDGFESEGLLRKQIPYLTEKEREYTGVGLYVYFLSGNEIENYKIPTDNAQSFDIDGNPTEMLNGVEVENEKLNILSDVTVHLTNGIIDCVEIWNKNGKDYPSDESSSYKLTQSWVDKS